MRTLLLIAILVFPVSAFGEFGAGAVESDAAEIYSNETITVSGFTDCCSITTVGGTITPVECYEPTSWTLQDTSLQAVFLTTLAIDRGQSVHSLDREELGLARVFVGSNPSRRELDQYFLGAALVHTAVAYVLPKPYRTIWQSVWIGIEVETVRRNVSVGLGVRF